MPYGMNQSADEMLFGDADSWGGPDNGVDLVGEAGIQVGATRWHTRLTSDAWTLIVLLGSLALLWLLGGVVFRKIAIF